jgi:WD40 repeat protein/serine/threonine protein kinase/tetratricopeptide (TPR) repeat protein
MQPDDARVEKIFGDALEIESAEERTAYLAEACGEDAALREAVESLLRDHARAGDFLEKPAIATEALANGPSWAPEGPGTLIGPYKLIEPIGEGGFAVVYRAEQLEPVRREVALKILKAGMDTRHVIARFQAERQALALMDHPNIARVYDAGATEQGRPYFAMELVPGEPITDYCDRHELDPHQRLELFIQACQGVQHAHQKGIIHRDLKPTNVLVIRQDGHPVPKVIDFGVAKALSRPLTEMTLFTRYGDLIGTPPYISPEQADAHREDIDTRADIYGLGALLYELLTGSPPFELQRLREAGFEEILRILREEEPPKPSTQLTRLGGRLGEVARHRQVAPATLTRLVHGELDWIVMKALDKERDRRYETAHGLARDIERHLNHEVVRAAAPGTIYRLGKFVRRHRHMVGAAALVSLALVAGLVASTIGFVRADWQKKRAEQERNRAVVAERAAATQRDAAIAARSETEQERDRARRGLARRQLGRGLRRLEQGASHGLLDLLDARLTAEKIPPLRNTAARLWAIAASQVEGRLVHVLGGESHIPRVKVEIGSQAWRSHYAYNRYGNARLNTDLAFSPDGKLIARGWGSTVWMWDTSTGRPHGDPAVLNEMIDSLAFSPDGMLLAAGMTAGGTYKGSFAQILDTSTGQPVILPIDGTVVAGASPVRRVNCGHRGGVAFSALGDLVALVTSNNIVEVRSTASGELQGTYPFAFPSTFSADDEFAATFSPDGKLLAVVSHLYRVQLWDLSTGQRHGPLLEYPHFGGGILEVLFTLTGDLLVTCIPAGGIFVSDLATFERRQLLPRPEHVDRFGHWYEMVWDVDLSPDDRLLAAGTDDGKIRLVEIATGRFHGEQPMEHLGQVTAVRFSPDGKLLATSSIDGTVSLWEVESGHRYGDPFYHGEEVATIAFSPEGEHLASLTVDGTVRIWRVVAPPRHRSIPLPGDTKVDVAFSADGRLLATTVKGELDYLPLWDTTTWKPHPRWPVQPGHAGVASAQFSPDGRWIATAGRDGMVRLWNLATGEFEPGGFLHDRSVWQVAFSQDTTRIAAGTKAADAKKVYVWDVASGKQVCPPVAIQGSRALAFHPDGRLLAIAARFPWIMDITAATSTRRIATGMDEVWGLTFSPDGNTLATGSRVHRVQVWEADTGRLAGELEGHSGPVGRVAYSPDGHLLASASDDGTVRLWAAELGAPWLSLVLRYPARLFSVAFSPDGGLLATGSEFDSTAWIRRLPPPPDLPEMQVRTWLALGLRHDSDANVQTIGWEEWLRLREELKQLQSHRKNEGADVVREHIGEGDAWLDRYKSAVGYMKKARKLADSGEMQEAKETLEQARALFEVLAEEFPDIQAYRIHQESYPSGALWYRRGLALAELEEWPEAATAFSKATAQGLNFTIATDASILNQWAWLLVTNPDVETRDPQTAVTLAKWAIEAEPEFGRSRLTLGIAQSAIGAWDEAVASFSKAVDLGVSAGELNNWVWRLAMSPDAKTRDPQAAVSLAKIVVEAAPEDAEFQYTLGVAQSAVGAWDEAVDSFSKAIELDPGNANALIVRAHAYLRLKEGAKAEADLAQVKAAGANTAHGFYRMALLQLGLENLDPYRRICATNVERFGPGEDANALHWVAWTCALAPDALSDLRAVVPLAERALGNDAKADSPRLTLGAILYRAGQYEEAIERLTELDAEWKSSGTMPSLTSPAYCWFFLAMAHHELGCPAEARQWFDKALQRMAEERDSAAWNRRLTLDLLRQEAESLLGAEAPVVDSAPSSR